MSRYLAFVSTLLLACSVLPVAAQEKRAAPGAIKLLPGYVHEPLQGFDSIVGKISKKDGLTISYEIGHLPKPGGFALGGDFSDRPKNTPKETLQWYQEQTVAGEEVHLAYGKDNVLQVSYPAHGVNFATTVKTPGEMAEALLILLSFPKPAAAAEAKAEEKK